MTEEMQEQPSLSGANSQDSKPPSGAEFLGLGLIVSARMEVIPKIVDAIQALGGKVVFQCTTRSPLYVLRHYQIEEILQGDLTFIQAAHERKSKEREEQR